MKQRRPTISCALSNFVAATLMQEKEAGLPNSKRWRTWEAHTTLKVSRGSLPKERRVEPSIPQANAHTLSMWDLLSKNEEAKTDGRTNLHTLHDVSQATVHIRDLLMHMLAYLAKLSRNNQFSDCRISLLKSFWTVCRSAVYRIVHHITRDKKNNFRSRECSSPPSPAW